MVKIDLENFQFQDDVGKGMANCVARLSAGSWLNPTIAVSNTQLSVENMLKDPSPVVEYQNYCDYAAASSILHCTDSWNYLGRALNAYFSGLFAEGSHFAYYSELRSAMSILASSGLIFANFDSYGLAGTQVKEVINGPTHASVWLALNEWFGTAGGIDTIGEIIRVGGASLNTWLDSRVRSGNTASTITSLSQQWGVDLANFAMDRLQRNIASYNPNRFTHHTANTLGDKDRREHLDGIKALLQEVCHLIEPTTQGGMENLDYKLLAQAILKVGGISLQPHNSLVTSAHPTLAELQAWSAATLGGGSVADQAANRLSVLFINNDSIITKAGNRSSTQYPVTKDSLEGMLGRAIILSRISTGYARLHLKKVNTSGNPMQYWADNIGLDLGFWEVSSKPSPLTDLWLDLFDSADDLRRDTSTSTKILEKTKAPVLLELTGVTRAALWNLSL